VHHKIEAYILKNGLISHNKPLLVALSGGADSVVLLHVLNRLGYPCHAAHVNFQLRGNESDDDTLFCRELCHKMQVPLHVSTCNAAIYAAEHKISVEMAARDIRYNWFTTLLHEHDLQCVAVAHHKNDQAETILLNMIRGAGVSGLKGMLPRNGNVVRPLLCVTRHEVDVYAHENNLLFRTDSSNHSLQYRRNTIRHKLLPQIIAQNPAFVNTIDRFAMRFNEAGSIVDEYIENWKHEHMHDHKSIPVDTLFENKHTTTLLHGLLSPYGFSPDLVAEIVAAYPFTTGAVFAANNYYLLADRGFLRIEPIDFSEICHQSFEIYPLPASNIPVSLKVSEYARNSDFQISTDPRIAQLDAHKIQFPLILRCPQQGDRFRPLGMKGFKKVSDFLIDAKVNLADKKRTFVVVSDNDIVWLVGHRIDDRYKITSNTTRIVQIMYIQD
jgi:tRNA(Ile)-lysidine synthase